MAFTFFMRDQPTLEYAAQHMIPYASGRRKIRVWDAGCALGQETYTIAMILAERMNGFAFRNLLIEATDYDSANRFGDTVREGIYHGEELKRTPPELREKYFNPAGREDHFQVIEPLRSRVRFSYHNLLSLTPHGDDYCLIVCKNVLLHFQPEERIKVLRMFHGALAAGGYLAMENTQKIPAELSHLFMQVVPDAQVYKKIEGTDR